MKFGFLVLIFLLSLLLGINFAQAGDVSCQVDLLKPKINAAVIQEEASKPAELTVAEARLRLHKINNIEDINEVKDIEQQLQENQQKTIQSDTEQVAAKTEEKPSRLGGMFDILLPSKLRDPVK